MNREIENRTRYSVSKLRCKMGGLDAAMETASGRVQACFAKKSVRLAPCVRLAV
jgi:hypothetical protein